MPQKYPQSIRFRAVRMVMDRLGADDAPARFIVIRESASKLRLAPETLRRWCAVVEIDSGCMPGVATDAAAQMRRLTWENAELRRANEILKTASA